MLMRLVDDDNEIPILEPDGLKALGHILLLSYVGQQ